MNSFRCLIVVFCLLAAAADGLAAGGGVQITSKRFKIRMTPVETNRPRPRPAAVANVDLSIIRSRRMVHWAVEPFHHSQNPELTSDSVLTARLTGTTGNVSVLPRRAADRTNLAKGDTSAGVAMRVKGTGRAKVRLRLALDNPDAAAGQHCATVVMTVTGP